MSDRRPKNGPNEPADDPDAPPSADEIAASNALREALEGGGSSDDLDLVKSLRAAWSPETLDERAHAAVLDDAPMSAEEIQLAAELRATLETGQKSDAMVTALRSAWSPAQLGDDEHRAIIEKAIGTSPAGKVASLRPKAKPGPMLSRPMRLSVVTTTTVLALAASVIVWVTSSAPRPSAPLAKARSTQPLFDEPFKAGETSARIDRIAMARASDYRDNRFAKWGVR